jgi:hypothetical protein
MAQILNKKEDYEYFMKRSQSWKIVRLKAGFIRPKKTVVGTALRSQEVNNNLQRVTPGNILFVPQDIPNDRCLWRGNQKIEAKLDQMFNSESKTTGRKLMLWITAIICTRKPSHHMVAAII